MKSGNLSLRLTPWRVVGTVLIALTVTELLIMFTIDNPFSSGELDQRALTVALLDALFLGLVMTPVVYFFLLIPLQKKTILEQEKIHALYDELSGLPTRKLFTEMVQHEISVASRNNNSLALIIIDPGRLSEINQIFGYDFGDTIIAEIGRRLRKSFRESDIKARLGGDEFGILLPSINKSGIDGIKDKIRCAFAEPFKVNEISVDLAVAMGVSIFPGHAPTGQMLIQRARVALSKAKIDLQELAVFDEDFESDIQDRLRLYGEIRRAIDSKDFELYYQPKIDLLSQKITGAEALLRWTVEPSKNTAEFIAFAERVGLIAEITKWVATETVRQIAAWQAVGMNIPVSINISARDLLDSSVSAQLTKLCKEHQVSPSLITIEITESVMMSQPESCITELQRLSEHGFRISIDDFGTGHSSLVYLRDLPADELKIDQSFIRTLDKDSNTDYLVSTIAGLGKQLDLDIVAEGIESDEVLSHVISDGCDTGQGYLFSRPLPAAQFIRWCHEWNTNKGHS